MDSIMVLESIMELRKRTIEEGDLELTRHRNFSPVPKRVMDGSEAGEVLPAAVLSGAPVELQGRTVR
jgi:hypothetical protein